ncbi:hypothetical protein D3C73_1186450 [compost metagenome]
MIKRQTLASRAKQAGSLSNSLLAAVPGDGAEGLIDSQDAVELVGDNHALLRFKCGGCDAQFMFVIDPLGYIAGEYHHRPLAIELNIQALGMTLKYLYAICALPSVFDELRSIAGQGLPYEFHKALGFALRQYIVHALPNTCGQGTTVRLFFGRGHLKVESIFIQHQ